MPPFQPGVRATASMARERMLIDQAKRRLQCIQYDTEIVDAGTDEATTWTLDMGSGANTKDLKVMAKWPILDFDITDSSNWTTDQSDFSVPHVKNVRVTDRVAFWAICCMSATQRNKYFPYDFGSHGDIRSFRPACGPTVVIEAHGLFWFPTYKGAYLLAGDYWKSLGWMLTNRIPGNTPDGTIDRKAISTHFDMGTILAPSEAAARQNTTVLRLEAHTLYGLDHIDEAIFQEARKHNVDVRFKVISDADIWTILDPNRVGFDTQLYVDGFHHLVRSTADPSDPGVAISRQVYETRGILSRYGQTYKVQSTPCNLRHKVDWAAIDVGDWKVRRLFPNTYSQDRHLNQPSDLDEVIPAALRIDRPQGAMFLQEVNTLTQQLSDFYCKGAVEAAKTVMAVRRVALLYCSFKSCPRAMEAYRMRLTRDERQELLDLLTAERPSTSRVQTLALTILGPEIPFVLDYIKWVDAYDLTEAEAGQLHASEMKNRIDAVLPNLAPPPRRQEEDDQKKKREVDQED